MSTKVFHPAFSTFNDTHLETEYIDRQTKIRQRVIRFALVIFMVNIVYLLYSDFFLTKIYQLEGNYLVHSRVYLGIYVAFVLIYFKKQLNYRQLELTTIGFFASLVLVNLVGHLTYPNPEEYLYTTDVITILAIYLLFPINIKYQIIGALTFMGSCFLSMDPTIQSEKIYYQTIAMFINANILGYFFSVYYQRTNRRLFFEMREEERITAELQQSKDELKILSGVIPVCYTCNSVREDDGYMNRLEDFIQKHSDAKFTHSMCPECMERYIEETKNIK